MIQHQARLSQFSSKCWKIISRNVKTKVEENKIKFTDSINLPKTKFPARLNQQQRAEVEEAIRTSHLSRLYDWQRKNLKSKHYVLHDGPPYANGNLHMGHAVNKILKDIILKQKIINGTRVHYKPGWDCHGLPIELKALGNAKNVAPHEIRKKAKKFATETLEKQKRSFESWGVTGSWHDSSHIYKTFDKSYIKNQLKVFYQMYERGLIFRDLKPVYFSPSSGTALAEAELEYDENFKSPSLYFRCETLGSENICGNEKLFALVWTTTPWTLPANQAICYSKDLRYYLTKINENNFIICGDTVENLKKELETDIEVVKEVESSIFEQLRYRHPINEDEILPFFPSVHVLADKGTGLVHTAPSHGQDDFLVFLNKKIPLKSLVNAKGCYNKLAPDFLQGMEVLGDGNKAVIEHVKQKDNIVTLKDFRHSYPIDWRTKSPVIILASEQWFINTDRIKSKAIEELEKVNIFPEKSAKVSKNVLKTQLEKRPYWCISRQRSWGVPIPVLYDSSKRPVISKELIDNYSNMVEQTGSIDFWWEREAKDLVPTGYENPSELSKGNDILDIWFDSGISWSHALENEQVADLYLEGVDQFTGWFQSSLMTSVGIREKAPYKNIFVHGFTVDEKGRKMSKSLGNIVSPDTIVKKYGIDVMRFWIAAHSTQHSLIPVSNKLLEDSANNLVKIRATIKYLLGIIGTDIDSTFNATKLSHLDKFILHQLSDYVENVNQFYDNFQFNRIIALANNFINTDLSSSYLHLIKDRLYCGFDSEHEQFRGILSVCYRELSKTLWPIMPFLVEESWKYIDPSRSFYQHQPMNDKWKFEESKKIIESALAVKRTLCSSLTDMNTLKLDVTIEGSDEILQDLKELHPEPKMTDSELSEVLQVSSVSLAPSPYPELKISHCVSNSELCPRCRRFPVVNGICFRCENVLKAKSIS